MRSEVYLATSFGVTTKRDGKENCFCACYNPKKYIITPSISKATQVVMVKAVHMQSFASQDPPGGKQNIKYEQHRPFEGESVAVPNNNNPSSVRHEAHHSNMYPPPYYPRVHAVNRSKHYTGQHYRGASRSHHSYQRVEGTNANVRSRHYVENTSFPPHPPTSSYNTNPAHPHRYLAVDERRFDHRHYEAHQSRYHHQQNRVREGGANHVPQYGHDHAANALATMNRRPVVFPSHKDIFKSPQNFRSGRNQPLQTIVPNKLLEVDEKKVAQTATKDKPSPAFNRGEENSRSLTADKFLKSPVSMCFERMLGAGKLMQSVFSAQFLYYFRS